MEKVRKEFLPGGKTGRKKRGKDSWHGLRPWNEFTFSVPSQIGTLTRGWKGRGETLGRGEFEIYGRCCIATKFRGVSQTGRGR